MRPHLPHLNRWRCFICDEGGGGVSTLSIIHSKNINTLSLKWSRGLGFCKRSPYRSFCPDRDGAAFIKTGKQKCRRGRRQLHTSDGYSGVTRVVLMHKCRILWFMDSSNSVYFWNDHLTNSSLWPEEITVFDDTVLIFRAVNKIRSINLNRTRGQNRHQVAGWTWQTFTEHFKTNFLK